MDGFLLVSSICCFVTFRVVGGSLCDPTGASEDIFLAPLTRSTYSPVDNGWISSKNVAFTRKQGAS